MTKIVSWNVNSIRVRMPHISELVHSVKPDVMLLQETKSTDENFPTEEIKNLGYFNPRFYITEISNSKKELRLLARHTSGNENLDLSDPDLQQAIINTFNADSGNYLLDFVLLQNGGVNNNILDFTFDSETDTENVSLIIRLYEATPFSLYD